MTRAATIATDLRARIANGEFDHGSKLPDVPELVARYQADASAVRQALHELQREGLVELTLVAFVV